MDRDRDLLLLRADRERDLLDFGGGDLRCRDVERLLERLTAGRLTGERVLDLRPPRLDLERDFLSFTERDRERLPAAPRLGVRLRDLFVLPLDLDLDLCRLFGDCETDLRFCFFLGEGELRRRLGDTEDRLDLGDLDTFFFGVMERELERDREGFFFSGLGDWDAFLLGDFERDREGSFFIGLGDGDGLLFGDFERDLEGSRLIGLGDGNGLLLGDFELDRDGWHSF